MATDTDEDLWDDDEAENQTGKYLLFDLGNESYGIQIAYIIQIVELQKITEIPNMPDYVKGILTIRGQMVPVIDLKTKFGIHETKQGTRNCIIITSIGTNSFGLLVDNVSEVKTIPNEAISPPPQLKDMAIEQEYIYGLGKINDEVKILLDVEQLFTEQEIEKLEG